MKNMQDDNIEVGLDGLIPIDGGDIASINTSGLREVPAKEAALGQRTAPQKNPKKSLLGFGFRNKTAQPQTIEFLPEVSPGTELPADVSLEARQADEVVARLPELENESAAAVSNSLSPSRSPTSPPLMEAMNLFSRKHGVRSYVYEEEDPLHSEDEGDNESLWAANEAEKYLASSLRVAEEGTGESLFGMSRAPRNDAIELGRRVSTFTMDHRNCSFLGRSPSLLGHDDEGSVHSFNSQATATTFVRVEEEGAPNSKEHWASILASMASFGAENEAPMVSSYEENKKVMAVLDSASWQFEPQRAPAVSMDGDHVNSRKWDKLRTTLEAQENGTSIGYEAQLGARSKSKMRDSKSLPKLAKGIRKTFGSLRPSKSKDSDERLPSLEPNAPSVQQDTLMKGENSDEPQGPVEDPQEVLETEEDNLPVQKRDSSKRGIGFRKTFGSLRPSKSKDVDERAPSTVATVLNTVGGVPRKVAENDPRGTVEERQKSGDSFVPFQKLHNNNATISAEEADDDYLFPVNIRVEDLSKICLPAAAINSSVDESEETDPETSYDPEAESMEIMYDSGKGSSWYGGLEGNVKTRIHGC